MSDTGFDLFVIGAGSGGVRAARLAAQRGASVAVAEPAPLGGTCVNLGCIPKKLYATAAHYADDFHDARGFGWPVQTPPFDWERLKANRALEIGRLNEVYEAVLVGAGATLLKGRARLVSAREVEVDGVRHAARRILVATGSHPVVPGFPGAELAVTSDAMFDLPRFPTRLVVVGGGYIACEMASIFCGLGAQVTLLARGERLLRGFDDEAVDFLALELGKKGVDIRLGTHLQHLDRDGERLRATLHDGRVLLADTVLVATGRAPRTADLGLEALGVQLGERGGVVVDETYRSSVPTIFALGDVIDRLQLTPVALAEAMVLVDHLFGSRTRRMSYEAVPTAVFTNPALSTVGLTEAEARQRHGSVRTYVSQFRALKHTLSGSSERTFMKLVVDDASDRVVGVHMVGADAGETMQGFAVGLNAGATKGQFDATIGIHPTAAEEFLTMREPAGR